eukprot:scpid84055/ scgid19058/ 
MTAPLTPSNFGSPRRVVKLEYETPQFLPSPACLAPNSACLSSGGGRPSTVARRKRTPRRIITSEVDGAVCEHEGQAYMDVVSGLMERSCMHIVQRIFCYLHEKDLHVIQRVCHKWRRAFSKDQVARQRHHDFCSSMQVYVRSMGVENAPGAKVLCVSEKVQVQRPGLSTRNALSDLSNTSSLKRDPKSTGGSEAACTPSRPSALEPGYRPTKLSGLTPQDAAKKAKKISSAKKDSRMRRLRC